MEELQAKAKSSFLPSLFFGVVFFLPYTSERVILLFPLKCWSNFHCLECVYFIVQFWIWRSSLCSGLTLSIQATCSQYFSVLNVNTFCCFKVCVCICVCVDVRGWHWQTVTTFTVLEGEICRRVIGKREILFLFFSFRLKDRRSTATSSFCFSFLVLPVHAVSVCADLINVAPASLFQ